MPADQLQPTTLNSSLIASVAYHDDERALEIRLRSGAGYRYLSVPREIFDGLLQAPSKGRFFNSVIRNHYAYARESER